MGQSSSSREMFFIFPILMKKDKFGVGLIPHMNTGDKTEILLHRFVGEMPEIDQIFNINDGQHMLETLIRLKKQGRRLDYLVIAGHGSRDTPGIKFAKDDMIPEEVDIDWNRAQLKMAQERLKKNPNQSSIQKKYQELQAYVKLLEGVNGVMKPGALVVLINCSAAATPKGRNFVTSFGKVLMGGTGGNIVASKVDTRLLEVEDIADWVHVLLKEWESVDWGTPRIFGEWVNFAIPRGGSPVVVTAPVKPKAPRKEKTPTTKPVKEANFSGTWYTSQASHMVMEQSGNRVKGEYNYAGGTIEGTVTGRTLDFTWKQNNGREGTGKFHMGDSGDSFTGEWDYTLPADAVGKGKDRGWSGNRKKK